LLAIDNNTIMALHTRIHCNIQKLHNSSPWIGDEMDEMDEYNNNKRFVSTCGAVRV